VQRALDEYGRIDVASPTPASARARLQRGRREWKAMVLTNVYGARADIRRHRRAA
jgi:hypothetical protein